MEDGKKLVKVAGEGYDYSEKEGRFEVRYGDIEKEFTKLSEAIDFYEVLVEESALWDMTWSAELLAAKAFGE